MALSFLLIFAGTLLVAAAAQARRLIRSPRAMRIANRISAGTMASAATAIAERL